jgi:hypothetical protein
MGESSGAKDSSITSSEFHPVGYHSKLVRAAMEIGEDVHDEQDDLIIDDYDMEDY